MKSKDKTKAIFLIFLTILIWFCISFFYSKWISPLVVSYAGESVGLFLRSILVPYGFAMPIAYLILRNVEVAPKRIGESCSVRCFVELAIVQSSLSILPLFLLHGLLVFVGVIDKDISTMPQEIGVMLIFLLLIFNPIAEEFLFRKLILDRLLKYGVIAGIVISSILFALPHAFSQGILQTFYTFVLAVVWAYARIKTQRLRIPILLHSLSNIWGMILPSFILNMDIGR